MLMTISLLQLFVRNHGNYVNKFVLTCYANGESHEAISGETAIASASSSDENMSWETASIGYSRYLDADDVTACGSCPDSDVSNVLSFESSITARQATADNTQVLTCVLGIEHGQFAFPSNAEVFMDGCRMRNPPCISHAVTRAAQPDVATLQAPPGTWGISPSRDSAPQCRGRTANANNGNMWAAQIERRHATNVGKEDYDKTAIMLRNIPSAYTPEMLLGVLDHHGFYETYDFFYAPIDFHTGNNLGYAFVNFENHADAMRAFGVFNGFSDWVVNTNKVCSVFWSDPHQGQKSFVNRYKNSPMMHHTFPDRYKPRVFTNGVLQPFPSPTKNIPRPRAWKDTAIANNRIDDIDSCMFSMYFHGFNS